MTRMKKHFRSLAAASLAAVLALGPAGPAAGDPADETHVDDLSASVSSGTLSVSGKATFVDGPVELGEDPAGDALVPGIGVDLTRATVTARVGAGSAPSATLTAFIDEMPELRGLQYRWHVSTSAPSTEWACFLGADVQGPRFSIGTCALGSNDISTAGVSASGRFESDRVEWTLPSVYMRPGESLTTSSLRTGMGATSGPSAFLLAFDEMTGVQRYDFPTPTLSLGIAPEGTPADEVPLTGTATVASNGTFQGSLPAGGLAPGAYVVVAEACFGEGPCALASTTVTI